MTDTVAFKAALSDLEYWRVHLEKISAQPDQSDSTDTWSKNTLFKAYEGKEDRMFGDVLQVSRRRFKDLITDAKLLHRLLYDMLVTPQKVSTSRDVLLKNLLLDSGATDLDELR